MKKTIFYSVGKCFDFFLQPYLQYQKKQKAQHELLQKHLRIRYYRKQRLAQGSAKQTWWKLCLLLFCYLPVQGQQMIHPLKIGDQVPDLNISVYQNGKFNTVSLADYQGKLLIIDFWATWCGGCVNRLAEDEALQHEFKNQLQFIMVNSLSTGDHQENTLAFLKKWQQNNGMVIHRPMILEDDLIIRLFPRRALPHYVWIDENGIVRAITHSKSVTKENILKAIHHQEYNYPVKTF
jgi:thiol-disulfide isomerase/thioredoxin